MVTLSPEDILEIQDGGIDYYGKPLEKNGWGPRTAWWYGILSLPVQRRLIVCKALQYYASGKVVDDGNNRGEWPDKFLKPAGLIGEPWCVAMTSYILRNEAWFEEDVWPYHTSTLHLIEWARKHDRIVKEPLPGDLVAFMHNDTEGHTEINLSTNINWVLDVGGNLSNTVKVGKRAKAGLTFIRTVDVEGSKLACPPLEGILNLDGTRTR
jgi:hypothetical protein